jgi:uncharacterized secreted protein with C-terminal beta-propeller domain
MKARALLGTAAASLLLLASPAAASTPVPKACPTTSLVSATLKQKVSKLSSTTATTATGSKRTCVYTTNLAAPTTIIFGSPVSAAAFTASQKAAAKGVTVVSVKGLGNAAWVVTRGNGLSVLTGTLDIVISAPETTDAELEALAHKIL